ncbi:MAG: type II toxin-antitoxin system VapC family toxin [Gammaproteobacteria bacterium]|nr:type II toxin-antitoxin system VapC family toxin [Gammaproteobacteria bacterium]
MRILLDTNAFAAFGRKATSVMSIVGRCDDILMSTVVLGELKHGFFGGNREKDNLAFLNQFLKEHAVSIIDVTAVTADRYGRIAASLKEKGTPIPANDTWIAAQTFETGAELITYDKHFACVPGLVYTIPE